jgi:hypothetical protein
MARALCLLQDKAWFSPVGAVLDERDALIREKLAAVKASVLPWPPESLYG